MSDNAQIYLVDADAPRIPDGILAFSQSDTDARVKISPNGLIIFTADCLRQQINLVIADSPVEPVLEEPASNDPWTSTKETSFAISSRHLTLASPSRVGTEAHGPRFSLTASRLQARISWLEYDDDRYNVFRPRPDVVRIELWPQ